MAKNWSEAEVEAAVEDYFNMLRLELAGRKYNKTEHRRALMENLDNRTDSSVELKHQNISAVLIEMGIPYINGYKPRFNYQRILLPSVVYNFLANNPEFQSLFQADTDTVPSIPTVADFLAALETPPKRGGQLLILQQFIIRVVSTILSGRRAIRNLGRLENNLLSIMKGQG